MPYNTRRKSLSLPSLGIHVPMSNAARAAAAAALANSRLSPKSQAHSPASSGPGSAGSTVAHSATSTSSSSTSLSSSSSSSPTFSPRSPANSSMSSTEARKIKRSHTHDARDSSHPAKRRQTEANTPPPSPPHSHATRAISVEMADVDDDNTSLRGGGDADFEIDLKSIHDEIVEAVIVQLQNTQNRPHIVKDLAAVLMKQLKIVENSANPAAIISSRLSGYLKRSCWNANNPCPLAKELETVHPRRTYFYLTTSPHQPLPDTSQAASKARELPTPSATSASEAEEDERRRELSPSPEVDLSAPEFDDVDDDDVPMPGTPIGSFPGRHSSVLALAAQSHRAASPPLEKDEKEFTQTADGLQRRKLSGEFLNSAPQQPAVVIEGVVEDHVKDETSLFGEPNTKTPASGAHHLNINNPPAMTLLTSPAMRPYAPDPKKEREQEALWSQLDSQLDWHRNPETVELDELDSMLTGF